MDRADVLKQIQRNVRILSEANAPEFQYIPLHQKPSPSVLRIQKVMSLLRSVIFPGFFDEEQTISLDSLPYYIGVYLEQIYDVLQEQIYDSLCFEAESCCSSARLRASDLAVSFLNQIPSEETSITYDPSEKTSITEQTFKEGLGDESVDSSKGSDAVSVYLPNGLQNTASSSSQNKNYERTATEVTYGVGKTHRTKLMKAGTIQKISIAATIDANAMPANMTEKEVKTLIAHAASPNLTADDVSIAYVETIDPYLAADRPVNLPVPAASGNPWWLALVLIIGGLVIGFVFVHKKLKDSSSDQADELKQLKEKAKEQEKQIADVNLKAAELIEKQTILTQELLEQQKQMQIENKPENDVSLDETIDDISSDIVYADSDKTLKELKSWIEKS